MTTLHVIRLAGPWEFAAQARFVEIPPGGTASASGSRMQVESSDDLPPPGRVRMPADWGQSLGPAFRGRVEYRRRFGRPTGLGVAAGATGSLSISRGATCSASAGERRGGAVAASAGERVWLVCDGADAWARLTLNGRPLGEVAGPAEPAEFDVTDLLDARNELVAAVECPRRLANGTCVDRGDRADLPGGLVGEVRLEIRVGCSASTQ